MAGLWDGKMKRLIQEAPQDFVSWLVQGAQLERELSPHLQGRSVDADILYRIVLDGCPFLLHIEFQRRTDPNMEKRTWEYNVLATCKFGIPVYSFVIYLKKEKNDRGRIAESPYVWKLSNGQEVHRFNFGVIKLWEIPAESLIKMGLRGLLPLVTLTKEGNRRQTVEVAIAELCPPGEAPKAELLSLTYGIASLVFEEEDDRSWLRRRFRMLDEILNESWAFQEIMQEGLQKGLEKGLQEGRQEAQKQEVQRQCQILLAFAEKRFPSLLQLAKEQITGIEEPEILQRLILNISLAQNAEEAKQFLLTLGSVQDY